jgi:putative transposase
MPKVIRFPYDASLYTRWIGVDLNTTGHAVVAADILSGKAIKLGKKMQYTKASATQNVTKLYRENKLWKLKKVKTRQKKEFKAVLHKIARRIVSFAESACAGIKFEKLFSYRNLHRREMGDSYEFSFENGSFVTFLHIVEKRALRRGIPVLYVNPTNTSKRCSGCGGFGRRVRKRFECPQCGKVIHADVNAAFNIAATPCTSDKEELHQMRTSRKMMRKLARAERFHTQGGIPGVPDHSGQRDMLFRWDNAPGLKGEVS